MPERQIDRQELVRQLRLPPQTVRRLIVEYRDWLSAAESQHFTALDLARLQIAARLILAGRPREEIEAALIATRQRGEALPSDGAVPNSRGGAFWPTSRPLSARGDAAGDRGRRRRPGHVGGGAGAAAPRGAATVARRDRAGCSAGARRPGQDADGADAHATRGEPPAQRTRDLSLAQVLPAHAHAPPVRLERLRRCDSRDRIGVCGASLSPVGRRALIEPVTAGIERGFPVRRHRLLRACEQGLQQPGRSSGARRSKALW